MGKRWMVPNLRRDAAAFCCCSFQLNLDSYAWIHCVPFAENRCGGVGILYLSPITHFTFVIVINIQYFCWFRITISRWEIETIEMCWKPKQRAERERAREKCKRIKCGGFFPSHFLAEYVYCAYRTVCRHMPLCSSSLCNLPLRLFAAQRRNYINPNENNSNMGAIRLAPRVCSCHAAQVDAKCTRCVSAAAFGDAGCGCARGSQYVYLILVAVWNQRLFGFRLCARGIIKANEWASATMYSNVCALHRWWW